MELRTDEWLYPSLLDDGKVTAHTCSYMMGDDGEFDLDWYPRSCPVDVKVPPLKLCRTKTINLLFKASLFEMYY